MTLLSTSYLAEICGTDKATVRKRCDGLERHPGPKNSVCYESTSALRRVLSVSDDKPSAERDRQLARLNQFRANLAEMQEQEKRGQLVPVTDVEQVVSSILGVLRSRVMGAPIRIAGELGVSVTVRRKVQQALQDESNLWLHELSDELSRNTLGVIRGLAAPAEGDGGRVGRKKKASKPGGKRGGRAVAKRKGAAGRGANAGAKSTGPGRAGRS